MGQGSNFDWSGCKPTRKEDDLGVSRGPGVSVPRPSLCLRGDSDQGRPTDVPGYAGPYMLLRQDDGVGQRAITKMIALEAVAGGCHVVADHWLFLILASLNRPGNAGGC